MTKTIIMKNSVLCIGIALVTLTNISNASNGVVTKSNATIDKTSSITTPTSDNNNYYLNRTNDEVIESIKSNTSEKSADQLIADDNAITENNISNEIQALDFNIITKADVFEFIESVNSKSIEKSADQRIAEDNAITENTISNEIQALDFDIINRYAISDEIIETPKLTKVEKTADQLIAADNLVTENNISNETISLDFQIINKKIIAGTGSK